MTEPTDAEHIPHTCGGFSGAFYGQHKRMPSAQEIWDAAIRSYRDLNRAPPAVAGEPKNPHAALQKAWAPGHKWEWTKLGEGRWWHHNGEPEWDPDWQYRLANTTTQPTQAQAGAVPLTDEQAKVLLKNSDLLDMFLHIGWYSAPRKNFDAHGLTLIRAIEAAHGITANSGKGDGNADT